MCIGNLTVPTPGENNNFSKQTPGENNFTTERSTCKGSIGPYTTPTPEMNLSPCQKRLRIVNTAPYLLTPCGT